MKKAPAAPSAAAAEDGQDDWELVSPRDTPDTEVAWVSTAKAGKAVSEHAMQARFETPAGLTAQNAWTCWVSEIATQPPRRLFLCHDIIQQCPLCIYKQRI